ncbi:hypothetical protein B0H14DRAFT_2642508 [Mycena olivaceomarginata]|nr:hypothetical protein B0H14DRAFT_2642508 [Mycena olivaceomarginata]
MTRSLTSSDQFLLRGSWTIGRCRNRTAHRLETKCLTEIKRLIKRGFAQLDIPMAMDGVYRCIDRISEFMGPILRGVYNYTGCHATVIIGGPMPKYSGELWTVQSVEKPNTECSVSCGVNRTAAADHWVHAKHVWTMTVTATRCSYLTMRPSSKEDNQDKDKEEVGCSCKERKVAMQKTGGGRWRGIVKERGVVKAQRGVKWGPWQHQGAAGAAGADNGADDCSGGEEGVGSGEGGACECASDEEEDEALIEVIVMVKRIAHHTRLKYARVYKHSQAVHITTKKAQLTSLNVVGNTVPTTTTPNSEPLPNQMPADMPAPQRSQHLNPGYTVPTPTTAASDSEPLLGQTHTTVMLDPPATASATPPVIDSESPKQIPEGRSLCPLQEGQPFPIGQDSAVEHARQAGEVLGPADLLVCLASAPAWFMDACGDIMKEGLGPHYNTVIAVWTRIKQASQFKQGPMNLPSKGHPKQIGAWITNVCSKHRMIPAGQQHTWWSGRGGGTHYSQSGDGKKEMEGVSSHPFISGDALSAGGDPTLQSSWEAAVGDVEGMVTYYEKFNKKF